MKQISKVGLVLLLALFYSCSPVCDVIFDTDANNEIDDQHAIAYLLLNDDVMNTLAISTNVTINGTIKDQCDEVQRVASLVNSEVDILEGATSNFEEIVGTLGQKEFDGCEAVDFMIEQALKHSPKHKLTLVPVGKLTNVALALAKEPSIIPNVKIVWLGSNYPDPGEHNLVMDIPAMNYILDTDADFSMAVCRYGQPSGTDAVRITMDRVEKEIAGRGPVAKSPVTGRHGGEFTCFGDYSLNLFQNIWKDEDGARALFDMACVAVVKNSQWCDAREIPAPVMVDGKWVDRPENPHCIKILENFDADAIIQDFIETLSR